MARVRLTDDARDDLRGFDAAARKRIVTALKKLETDPELRGQPLGSKAPGNLTTFRKLVVGDRDYRIVYRVEESGDVVVVWVIGRRTDAEVYVLAVNRLQLHEDPAVRAIGDTIRPLIRGTETDG